MAVLTCGQSQKLLKEPESRYGSWTVGLVPSSKTLFINRPIGWLSPELYLRRPPAMNAQYRLDRILQRAAQRGVRINVIVYKEVRSEWHTSVTED